MDFKKRLLTIVLSVVLVLSLALPVVAATKSPKNPGYTESNGKGLDVNDQDHKGNPDLKVTTIVSSTPHTTIKVTSVTGKPDAVDINTARNKNNRKVAIKRLGDKKNGVFNNKNGQKIKTVQIKTPGATMNVSANAFKGSNVSTIKVSCKKIYFAANSFKGTKVKNPKIVIQGNKRKAASFSFAKGAWTGLNSKATIVVKKSTMTKAEFNKLKKRLVKSGFPGTIKYQ
jgi:hypothetical protein